MKFQKKMIKCYHFSRISGMKKKNDEGRYAFWSEHYQYRGKSFNINPQTHVMIVLCDNCRENHLYSDQTCELVYNPKGQIQTIYLFNVEIYGDIWIDDKQTIGTIFYKYPGLIYAPGKIINDQEFFTNVTQNLKMKSCIKRYCIFSPTKKPLINIHRKDTDKQILCNLEYGWTFFCVCHPFQHKTYSFFTTSKHSLISVKCSNPVICQYFIFYEKNTPPSLFNLSLSSVVQNNLNHTLDKTICEKTPKCHQHHLLPTEMRRYNIHCTGNGEYSPLISNW
jgi:hypothetical protein